MRRSQLRPDPEKVREWMAKSRQPLKRTPPKRREKISDHTRRKVYARSKRRCVVCHRRVRLWIHHVLPVRLWPDLTTVEANMVGICGDCHERHENASRRIRWDELPQCAITLAQTTSGAAVVYMERTYTR